MKRILDRCVGLFSAWTLAAAVLCAVPAMADFPLDPPRRDPTAQIATRDELTAYFAASAATPFDGLSPGARERFLSSLVFGSGGLTSMDPTDLADELEDAQIQALLKLFGDVVLAHAPASRVQEVRALERRVRKRAGIGPAERAYNDFYIAMKDIRHAEHAVEARMLGELFDTRIAPMYARDALRKLDDHELRLMRRGVRTIAQATRERRHIEAFERVFAERERREIVSTDDVVSLRDLLVALRRFGDARALAEKYPHAKLTPLPQLRDALGKDGAGPTVWRIEETGRRLTRERIDLAASRIVVTVSRACHFSRDAGEDIPKDELLGPVFARHALWLVRPPGFEPMERAAEWNMERPGAPVVAQYDAAEWAMLPDWSTPTFYFVRDGKVVDTARGWSRRSPETRDALIAALRRNGLLPAQ